MDSIHWEVTALTKKPEKGKFISQGDLDDYIVALEAKRTAEITVQQAKAELEMTMAKFKRVSLVFSQKLRRLSKKYKAPLYDRDIDALTGEIKPGKVKR